MTADVESLCGFRDGRYCQALGKKLSVDRVTW